MRNNIIKPGNSWYARLLLIFIIFSCKNEEKPIVPVNEKPEDAVVFDMEVGDSEIPYIIISTHDQRIENEPKIPADMKIYVGKKEIQSAHIGIEYRGSTSFRLSDKKSYGIETWDENDNDMKVGFFDFPEEEDWILNGHVVNMGDGWIIDQTLMYHYLGYQLSRNIGRYASRSKFVELEINGEYMGLYVFMEKLKRDANRIDIASLSATDTDSLSISGGYILKIDKTAGGDLNLDQPLEYYYNNWQDDATYTPEISFRSNYDLYGNLINFEPYGPPYHENQYMETYFLYEYPKARDITDAQKSYIQEYMANFETALLSDDFSSEERTYTDYIDISSFVDYLILTELCRNVDGYRLSTYLTKDRSGKLNMGPIWDLNIGFDSGDRIPFDGWVFNYSQYVERDAWMVHFWWPRLMEDPQFREALKTRWISLRSGELSDGAILGLVDETANYLLGNKAVERNYMKWDVNGVDYNNSIKNLKSYLEYRTHWMDDEISAF